MSTCDGWMSYPSSVSCGRAETEDRHPMIPSTALPESAREYKAKAMTVIGLSSHLASLRCLLRAGSLVRGGTEFASGGLWAQQDEATACILPRIFD